MKTKLLTLLVALACLSQVAFAGSKKEAIDLLAKVHKEYRSADAVLISYTLSSTLKVGEEPETHTFTVTLGDEYGQLSSNSLQKTWSDGMAYLTLNSAPDAYMEVKAKTFLAGLEELPQEGGVPWVVALQESRSLKKWLRALCNGASDAEIIGVAPNPDQPSEQVISIKNDVGTTSVVVTDANVIKNVVNTLAPKGGPPVILDLVSKTQFLDSIPATPFDTTDKVKVGTWLELEAIAEKERGNKTNKKSATKEKENAAPDFTIEKLDGSGSVTLSDLKGKIVVLDFWATWCPPCTKGLPLLNKYDEENSSSLVKVFAVNVWERGTEQEVLDKVKAFWKSNKYKTEVLLGTSSLDLTKNYGVTGIPTTIVIDMHGNIFDKHVGYSNTMVEDLKKSVQGAFQASK